MSTLSTKRRLLAVMLRRHGREVDIYEPTQGSSDQYGTPAHTKTLITTEYAYPSFTQDRDPELMFLGSGPSINEEPRLLFRHDSAIEDGHWVSFGGKTYSVDSKIRFDSHVEVETMLLDTDG
jgi:hypothetical protein